MHVDFRHAGEVLLSIGNAFACTYPIFFVSWQHLKHLISAVGDWQVSGPLLDTDRLVLALQM